MISFIKKNINPRSRKCGDCVIRAIAFATGESWEMTLENLCAIGLKIKTPPNDKSAYEKYLSQRGFIKCKQPRKADGSKFLISQIDELINKTYFDGKPIEAVVISCANHLTVVTDNTCFDTWDCRGKTICNYYVKTVEV